MPSACPYKLLVLEMSAVSLLIIAVMIGSIISYCCTDEMNGSDAKHLAHSRCSVNMNSCFSFSISGVKSRPPTESENFSFCRVGNFAGPMKTPDLTGVLILVSNTFHQFIQCSLTNALLLTNLGTAGLGGRLLPCNSRKCAVLPHHILRKLHFHSLWLFPNFQDQGCGL